MTNEGPTFSQRTGMEPVERPFQVGEMDRDLRVGLWNATYRLLQLRLFASPINVTGTDPFGVLEHLWCERLGRPLDEMPHARFIAETLKEKFLDGPWNEVYDIVEDIVLSRADVKLPPQDPASFPPRRRGRIAATQTNTFTREGCAEAFNKVLEKHCAGYRFVGDRLVQMTSEHEMEAIEEAREKSAPLAGVSTHIDTAIQLLSDRESPDYRNSVKESISAVEAICRQVTGKPNATLGGALKELGRDGHIHQALEKGFLRIYGYTSDKKTGIRHAMMEENKTTHNDAKFMLVACSAFINYVLGRCAEAGRNLEESTKGVTP
jgi:AbiJ N-terminal domain 4